MIKPIFVKNKIEQTKNQAKNHTKNYAKNDRTANNSAIHTRATNFQNIWDRFHICKPLKCANSPTQPTLAHLVQTALVQTALIPANKTLSSEVYRTHSNEPISVEKQKQIVKKELATANKELSLASEAKTFLKIALPAIAGGILFCFFNPTIKNGAEMAVVINLMVGTILPIYLTLASQDIHKKYENKKIKQSIVASELLDNKNITDSEIKEKLETLRTQKFKKKSIIDPIIWHYLRCKIKPQISSVEQIEIARELASGVSPRSNALKGNFGIIAGLTALTAISGIILASIPLPTTEYALSFAETLQLLTVSIAINTMWVAPSCLISGLIFAFLEFPARKTFVKKLLEIEAITEPVAVEILEKIIGKKKPKTIKIDKTAGTKVRIDISDSTILADTISDNRNTKINENTEYPEYAKSENSNGGMKKHFQT